MSYPVDQIPYRLTDEQIENLRGPMGGGRMLTADEARTLVDAYVYARSDADALRRDFPPAPPLPTLGCQCRTCAILRRQQDER